MKEFKTYHPIVNFIYFLFVIGFSMFLMNPLCLMISLVSGFTYSILLKGKKEIRTKLIYLLPIILIMASVNPLFNHEGITILGYLPSGNPFTLESVLYGIAAAFMIVSVICWFSCYNEIMTSDKFIYLFGKILPSLSLILSMSLRFVPRFSEQFKAIINSQKCIGRDISKGNILKRIKIAFSVLSILVTHAFENSIETADSMKSRGYGIPGRTAFSIFKFDKRDKIVLLSIMILGIYTFIGNFIGKIHFRYFPSIKATDLSLFHVSIYLTYFILCIFPILIELWEVIKWKSIKQKI